LRQGVGLSAIPGASTILNTERFETGVCPRINLKTCLYHFRCSHLIGKFQGYVSDLTASQLGAIVVREAVKRADIDPSHVNEVIMRSVAAAGLGQTGASPMVRIVA
jgi:hypothetical protein